MLSEPIRNVMERKRLVLAAPDTTVAVAAKLMAASKVGAVMVVEGKRLVGIFTERDAVLKLPDRRPAAFDVRDLMTRDPVVLRADDTLAVAIHKMAVGEFRHVPVVEDGRPIAVVSARDAFRQIATRLG